MITHGPPVGHGDLCEGGARAGCVDLLTTMQSRVKPKYHVFGHIHEGERKGHWGGGMYEPLRKKTVLYVVGVVLGVA